MADKLVEMFNDTVKEIGDGATDFQLFQAGFTKAAVSMRERAMKVCDGKKDVNEIKNGIGSLPDIP